MPNFAANLTMMFNEVDFLDRFAAAANFGFKGVEYLFPYDYEPAQLFEKLEQHGLAQVLHNLPAGDWAAGERGIACHPDRVGEFQEGVGKAIEYAAALNCPQVNCLSGLAQDGVSDEDRDATIISNLKFAAEHLGAAGIRLLIEPINTIDIPGFVLNYPEQARDLIERVGSDNLFLQHDLYHMQIMQGDLARNIERNQDIIRHIQIADNPGRHEPGTGEINYSYLFKYLDDIGYDGWIGCEYVPASTTDAGLSWIKPHL